MRKLAQRYYTGKELRNIGYTNYDIKNFIDDGKLVKLKSGIYREASIYTEYQNFIDVSVAIPNGIIAGFSAIQYYQLSTFIPQKINVAILRNSRFPIKIYPPIEVIFMTEKYFNYGVNTIMEGKYSFKIFNLEKSVCDVFRYRNKMGVATAKEILKEYLKNPEKNINKLLETAQYCRVRKIIENWLTAVI